MAETKKKCAWCSKPILAAEPITYESKGEVMYFDTQNCLITYRKLRSVYGDTFLDDQEETTRTSKEPLNLSATEEASGKTLEPASSAEIHFEFKSAQSKQVFDYLVEAFITDYMKSRRFIEQSGWRSLTEISQIAKVPPSNLYGKQGKYGPALNELLSRGLVETRFLSGQRGRGGEVVKVRVNYEREPVKRYVEKSITKPSL